MEVDSSVASRAAAEEAVLRRISSSFLWFLLICHMVKFIDRTNIGFAALIMNKELGLSATTFGLAGSALSPPRGLLEPHATSRTPHEMAVATSSES